MMTALPQLLLRHTFLAFWLLVLGQGAFLHADIPYTVTFDGVDDADTERVLEGVSQLMALEENPPVNETALRRRAEADIARLLGGLHNLAYYDAEITVDVDPTSVPALVTFHVTTGPEFKLKAFHLLHVSDIGTVGPDLQDNPDLEEETNLEEQDAEAAQNYDDPDICYDDVDLEDLGIYLDTPAYPELILDAEDALLDWLADQGYPLASLAKREVIADQLDKTVEVWLFVDSGPLAHFGDTIITGLKRVHERLVTRKITWSPGDQYDPDQVQRTVCALEKTGLFTSIDISPAEELDEYERLPMNITLAEGRHRSVGFGVSYATQPGAGVVAEWETRNFRGMGERFAIKAEIAQYLQTGLIHYVKPEFRHPDQDLIIDLEGDHEITDGFHETSVTQLTKIRRKLNCHTYASAGLALTYMLSQKSDNNRHFLLVKLPLQLLWNNTGSILDPCDGISVNLRLTPTFEVLQPTLNYHVAQIDGAMYIPFDDDHRWVLATKLSLGSILGASRISIPPPERFYAGSPTLLRGYRFMSVSPLNADNKPIGGRSLLVYSVEMRHRWSEDWGAAVFYDVGNVYAPTFPELNAKQLQGVGAGIRYFTAVGPLRLDFAYPINRRKGVDPAFQVYFSIGQTF